MERLGCSDTDIKGPIKRQNDRHSCVQPSAIQEQNLWPALELDVLTLLRAPYARRLQGEPQAARREGYRRRQQNYRGRRDLRTPEHLRVRRSQFWIHRETASPSGAITRLPPRVCHGRLRPHERPDSRIDTVDCASGTPRRGRRHPAHRRCRSQTLSASLSAALLSPCDLSAGNSPGVQSLSAQLMSDGRHSTPGARRASCAPRMARIYQTSADRDNRHRRSTGLAPGG
jgi:hypothetical protein